MSEREPTFPHCDPRVIHAPGECTICDKYSKLLQDARKYWKINYTGHKAEGFAPCPADVARGDTHANWGGNVAQKRLCKNCKRPQPDHTKTPGADTEKCLFGASFFDPMTDAEETVFHQQVNADFLKALGVRGE